jgi:hypothetical protein
MEAVRDNKEAFIINQQQFQVGRSGVYDHLKRKSEKLN